MQNNSLWPRYRNENCIIQRNLGVPLYYRCNYCNTTSKECLGMQFNLTVGIIIFVLLLLPLLPLAGWQARVAQLLVVVIMLLRLGLLVNNKTDELVVEHFNLDDRNKELTTMLDTTTAITSQLDLDSILNTLVEHIQDVVDCAFAKMFLLTDTKEKQFVIKAAYAGKDIEWVSGLGDTFKLKSDSPMLSILAKHEPVLLDYDQVLAMCEDKSMLHHLISDIDNTQSLLIVPVCMQGECLGFVVLGERRGKQRSLIAKKSDLILSLVNHAGIAIKNARHYQALHKVHMETIIGLAEALEARDCYTRGHSDRMLEYAIALARMLNLTPEQEDRLWYATILHDIGKIGIPDNILSKPGRLTEEEMAIMETHSVKGANIVSKIQFLEGIASVILHHHEHWDGSGYPDGLIENAIPIESRIVAVLDSYDAMTADRIYRPALDKDQVINELRRCSGTMYDPKVVEAFFKIINVSQMVETV